MYQGQGRRMIITLPLCRYAVIDNQQLFLFLIVTTDNLFLGMAFFSWIRLCKAVCKACCFSFPSWKVLEPTTAACLEQTEQ
jgi:hypothetical protein